MFFLAEYKNNLYFDTMYNRIFFAYIATLASLPNKIFVVKTIIFGLEADEVDITQTYIMY